MEYVLSLPPLSASKINGLVVTSIKSPKPLNLEEKSKDWLSGLPLRLESVKLGRPHCIKLFNFFLFSIFKFSTINPDKGLWTRSLLLFVLNGLIYLE